MVRGGLLRHNGKMGMVFGSSTGFRRRGGLPAGSRPWAVRGPGPGGAGSGSSGVW